MVACSCGVGWQMTGLAWILQSEPGVFMSTFVSLTSRLEGWFDKQLADIPEEVRQLIEEEFFPFTWDKCSESDRRFIAKQEDLGNDPATESFREIRWEYAERRSDIELEIKEWQSRATPTALDLQAQSDNLKRLAHELQNLDADFSAKAAQFDDNHHPIKVTAKRGRPRKEPQEANGVVKAPSKPQTARERQRAATVAKYRRWGQLVLAKEKMHPNQTRNWCIEKVAEELKVNKSYVRRHMIT
jgi:hypothetical protein